MPGDPSETGAYNPTGFIKDLISEGTLPTEGLDIFREAGGRINDARWFEMYRSTAETLANEPAYLALDPTALPSPSDYAEAAFGRGGQYATQVVVQMRDVETGLWHDQLALYVTDEPHTPEEAQAWAMGTFGDPDDEETYEVNVMGALALHVWTTVPYGSI